ncbi:uncharacterized protein BDZ99DRAFT_375830 [Mytilinidion resinicola]|uniref:Uncharacterized protein n=1 Tax=Mytilinidion resinicola TaxID=574789 RepID=A0A6A6Z8D9_9PEZI|nr:uncharacterized protein BDZ99DRAFT_375830 [Mytilinidion resinicola]KAF2816545.1 hypothetical protein BDZ99DRAFT_375830 [Mytilinidion resinicola]
MAPVEPDSRTSNTLPIVIFSTQVALVASLSLVVLRTICRAARTLPPPSSTRAQQTSRKREVAVFATLAGLSLATITYCTVTWRIASYLSWVEEGKFEIPGSIWSGWYGTGEGSDAARWWLGSWLQDVGYLKEAEDLGLTVPSGVFWLDQEFLGLAVAGLFMGVEGHRRNLPLSTTVSFVLLSQVGGLSYALNLFFLAMIYTPIPLHRALPPRRDPLWTPKPLVYRVPLLLSFVSLAFMYRNTNSDLAKIALRIGYFALPIYLATAIEFIPSSWGIQHNTTTSAHRSLLSFFRFASFVSPVFYIFDTFRSFQAETPSKHYTGYNYVWNMHTGGIRSPYDRATGAISGFLESLSKHPGLSATSSDVALAALSLCIWAFVRGLDVSEMLNSGFLAYFFGNDKHAKHVAFGTELESKPVEEPSPSETPGKRTRGRPKKSETVSKKNGIVSGSLRRSTRRKTISEQGSDSEDSFKPSTHTKDEIAATEHDTAEGDDLVADGEAAALGLGLYIVGGLGTIAAAVLGAEIAGN